MNESIHPDLVLEILVAAPGVLFGALALTWILGWTPGERLLARLTAWLFSLMTVGMLWLGWMIRPLPEVGIRTASGDWFRAGEYHFKISLVADWLSWPLMLLTVLLVGLVGVFSVRYLHRDRGYFKFFLLLHLFAFGALLVLAAGSFDLLLGGWELVGISSVLLIGFFDERREPVRNAMRVFAFYRVADLGLLLGIFLLHTNPQAGTAIGLLFLMAAAGKSAQAPFSGWLVRAMEGPTPSSAIFYGAIAVHLGAYLLLRAQPLSNGSPWVQIATIATGAVTALLATLVHRVSVDAKTSLAYAGMAQLGLIFVEIGCGLPQLALAHMGGHAVVRTLQFLRAPSALHDYHRVHAAAGGHLEKTGTHYERILPDPVRLWLYRAAVERGYYDALLDRLVVSPVMRLARWCAAFEPGAAAAQPAPPRISVAAEHPLAERMEG